MKTNRLRGGAMRIGGTLGSFSLAAALCNPVGAGQPNYCCPPVECPPVECWPSEAPSAESDADALDDSLDVAPGPAAQTPPVNLAPTPSPPSSQFALGSSGNVAPNMIGDTGVGGCGGLRLADDIVATLNHPIYACSRLNIAENNSPRVQDRIYVSYRHFHNASGFNFFPDSPNGVARDFNIDQYTIGAEKTIGDFSSIELRVPINTQLESYLELIQDTGVVYPDGTNNNLAIVGTDTNLGNIALIFKQVLLESDYGDLWTWGLGVNIPTAPDLYINGRYVQGAYDIRFDGVYHNDTVNLQPFTAFLLYPSDRCFTQGFLQCDVPVNEAPGNIGIRSNGPIAGDYGGPGTLPQQTLLRANLGVGCWLGDISNRATVKNAVVFEAHYTGTLEPFDGDPIEIPTGPDTTPPDRDVVELLLGPIARNTNVVNLTSGFVTAFRETTIYNGFTVPLREGSDRGFDFEYSLIINRNF